MSGSREHPPQPPLEQTKHIEHACHDCPIVRAARVELNYLKLTQTWEQEMAPDSHEMMSKAFELLMRDLGGEGGLSPSEIRANVGSAQARRLDSLDALVEEHLGHAETLLAGCEGPVSFSAVVRGRRLGIVACGSPALNGTDNEGELVHITRLEAVDDEAE